MRRERDISPRPFDGVLLREFDQTCGACPSQWEAQGPDGERVYIRFRHGWFRVEVDGTAEFATAADGDGVMSTDEMLRLTGFTIESWKSISDD